MADRFNELLERAGRFSVSCGELMGFDGIACSRAMRGSAHHIGHLGISQSDLLPGEVVLKNWNSPHGIGVLTRSRVMLFGPRSPIHRRLEWVADLNQIASLEVVQLDEIRQYGYAAHATFLGGGREGGRYFLGTIQGNFDVRIDGVTLFRGTPSKSEEIQQWIDSAMAKQMAAKRAPTNF